MKYRVLFILIDVECSEPVVSQGTQEQNSPTKSGKSHKLV